MSNMENELALSKIDTRQAMIEFLEGYALERKEELDQRKVRRGLLKTYLLETLDSPVPADRRLANALRSVQIKAEPIEDGLYRVVDLGSQKYVGFLETVGERFSSQYTFQVYRFYTWQKCLNPIFLSKKLWRRGYKSRTAFLIVAKPKESTPRLEQNLIRLGVSFEKRDLPPYVVYVPTSRHVEPAEVVDGLAFLY